MRTQSTAVAMVNRVGVGRRILGMLPTLVLVCLGFQTSAADARIVTYNLDIPAQSLSDALQALALASQHKLLYSSELVEGKSAPALKGEFTTEQAVKALLSGTNLSYEVTADGMVLIGVPGGPAGSRPAVGDAPSAAGVRSPELERPSFWQRLRLAQAESATSTAQGSEAASEAVRLEEVIVSAQKREEKLQNVPISISVLSGEDLDRSTFSDATEALRRVPGVALVDFAYGGTTQVPIRGVTNGSNIDSGPSTTAYYIDSIPFGFVRSSFAPSPDAYDLERVEVLRGPQGTLYGASSLNGVVRVLTKDANPDTFEFKARGLTSRTKGGDGNYRADAALNVPLIEGKLAARAVVGYQDLGGWIDKDNDRDANDARRKNVRLKVNAKPTEALSIGLSAGLSRSDFDAPSNARDDGRSLSLFDEPISLDYDTYGLTIKYDFPLFSVSSMTSYIDFANRMDFDIVHGIPGFHFNILEDFTAETFSQEVAVSSASQGAWRWSAGVMYRDSEDIDHAELPFLFVTPLTMVYHSKSYAVFGELTRLFLNGQWELTAGLRYFEDDLAQNEESRWRGALDPVVTPDQLTQTDATFEATTPRFVLGWHPNEQLNVYASYSEGFRSGWHQFPAVLQVTSFPPVEPDSLTNYELGAKGSLLGGRLAFDAAIYYIDWQDIQQTLKAPIFAGAVCPDQCIQAGVNGESASGVGLDFGLTVTPIASLQLGLNFSWNDLAFDDDIVSDGVVLFPKGERLNNSAEYTVGASADYVFPLGRNGFEGRFAVSADYASKTVLRSLVGPVVVAGVTDSYVIGRSSVSIQAPGGWAASLFVDNFTNESRPATGSDLSDAAVRLRPRTIGVQFEYQFGN